MASKTKVHKMSATDVATLISEAIASQEHHITANWLCDVIGSTQIICVQFSAWLPSAVKDSDGEFVRDKRNKIVKESEFKNRKVHIGVREDGQCTLFQHYYPKSVSAGTVPEGVTQHTVAGVAGVLVAADLLTFRKLCAYMGIPVDITGKSPEHTLELYHGKVTAWITNNAALLDATRTDPPTSGSANADRGVRIAFEL